jgi:hypothetical protein
VRTEVILELVIKDFVRFALVAGSNDHHHRRVSRAAEPGTAAGRTLERVARGLPVVEFARPADRS